MPPNRRRPQRYAWYAKAAPQSLPEALDQVDRALQNVKIETPSDPKAESILRQPPQLEDQLAEIEKAERTDHARRAIASASKRSVEALPKQLGRPKGSEGMTTTEKVNRALLFIKEDPHITRAALAEKLGVNPSLFTKKKGKWAVVNRFLSGR